MNTLTRELFDPVEFDPMDANGMKIVLDGRSKRDNQQGKAILSSMIRVNGDAYPNPAFVELKGGVTLQFINNRDGSYTIRFYGENANVESVVSTEEFDDMMEMIQFNIENAD